MIDLTGLNSNRKGKASISQHRRNSRNKLASMCPYCMANHDRPIYVRVFGMGKIHWYVIEEKTPVDLDDQKSLIGCESDHDRIRRLPSLCSDFDIHEMIPACSNNIAVINSTVFLIGGDACSQKKKKEASRVSDKCIAYQRMELDLGAGEWQPDGGNLVIYQGGGAAVGSDGCIYTVGYNLFRFCPGGRFHEELSSPPSLVEDKVNEPRLLGLTRKNLFIYTIEGGLNGANRMLSFDLESRKWDILDDNSRGDWSAGVVLYDDVYLFSFCKQNPTRQEEAEVPGIYVFDIKNRKWLPEPVEGLPTDGTVLPLIYTPDPDSDVYVDDTFSAFLLQIGNQNEHKLALLWDSHGTHPESHSPYLECVWSKFVLNRSTSASDQDPHFYANSISSGFCPLDEYTFRIINSAAGM